jgi:NIMA (never in mitosis gene a)-related kinase
MQTPAKSRAPLDNPLTPLEHLAPRDQGWRSPMEPHSPGRFASACISDFELLEKLGKGNCGVVHKARRLADNQMYVIKQIDTVALHPDELQQAVVEAQVLAALDNRYIIQYCDSFVDEDMLNIVMEWASAGNLNDVIERGRNSGTPLSENAVWRFLIQLMLGMQHIHRKKIVHRDIKSLNIFLADDDFIKIGDLGVARFMSTNTQMAETVVGTPFYMSPELFEEKPYSTKTGACHPCKIRHLPMNCHGIPGANRQY